VNGEHERLKHEGRLAVLDRQIKELRLRLAGLRDSLRSYLDPIDPPESLPGEQIAALAIEFARLQTELQEIFEQYGAVRKVLGR